MSGINTGDENKEIIATYPDACKILNRKPPLTSSSTFTKAVKSSSDGQK
jgi:hypothetical protein